MRRLTETIVVQSNDRRVVLLFIFAANKLFALGTVVGKVGGCKASLRDRVVAPKAYEQCLVYRYDIRGVLDVKNNRMLDTMNDRESCRKNLPNFRRAFRNLGSRYPSPNAPRPSHSYSRFRPRD